jgi:hypothetical protein
LSSFIDGRTLEAPTKEQFKMKNVLSAAIQNTADAGIDMELSDEYFHPYLDHLVGDHVVITEIVTTYLNYLLKGSK